MNDELKGERAELIDNAIDNFLNALSINEAKLSVGDVARLLDLRKEFARDEIREVRVKWVDFNQAPFVIN
jgi:hypothetical protein